MQNLDKVQPQEIENAQQQTTRLAKGDIDLSTLRLSGKRLVHNIINSLTKSYVMEDFTEHRHCILTLNIREYELVARYIRIILNKVSCYKRSRAVYITYKQLFEDII